jgi:hypothetical protein
LSFTVYAGVNSKVVPFAVSAEPISNGEDIADWNLADSSYKEFKHSGKKSQSINKLASEIGVA